MKVGRKLDGRGFTYNAAHSCVTTHKVVPIRWEVGKKKLGGRGLKLNAVHSCATAHEVNHQRDLHREAPMVMLWDTGTSVVRGKRWPFKFLGASRRQKTAEAKQANKCTHRNGS